MVEILIMSAKFSTIDLHKAKVFWKGISKVSVHDVTNETLSREPNYNLDAVMWPKLGNSNISMREVTITSTL